LPWQATFASNANLAAFFTVLSTNLDRGGKPFASTIEGKKYPVWGSQWHPEKNIFEWTSREAIPHSRAAVELAQYVSHLHPRHAVSDSLFCNVFKYSASRSAFI
jgi:gamma-glutamyl hydrolase